MLVYKLDHDDAATGRLNTHVSRHHHQNIASSCLGPLNESRKASVMRLVKTHLETLFQKANPTRVVIREHRVCLSGHPTRRNFSDTTTATRPSTWFETAREARRSPDIAQDRQRPRRIRQV